MEEKKSGRPQIVIPVDQIEEFCKSHHIKHLSLYGSVLTDRFTDASDVDVLVEFDPNHIPGFFGLIDMEDEMSVIIGRKIDLHTPKDLSRYFRDEVIKQAYPLYG
jgi:predicted nucleotidyltransferase